MTLDGVGISLLMVAVTALIVRVFDATWWTLSLLVAMASWSVAQAVRAWR